MFKIYVRLAFEAEHLECRWPIVDTGNGGHFWGKSMDETGSNYPRERVGDVINYLLNFKVIDQIEVRTA